MWAIGPHFSASQLVPADADLIAGGLLLDLKTTARPELPLSDIFQLAAYALMDSRNQYRLDTVGVFLARYGHLTTWPLEAFLSELAGHPVDVSQARGLPGPAHVCLYRPPARRLTQAPYTRETGRRQSRRTLPHPRSRSAFAAPGQAGRPRWRAA